MPSAGDHPSRRSVLLATAALVLSACGADHHDTPIAVQPTHRPEASPTVDSSPPTTLPTPVPAPSRSSFLTPTSTAAASVPATPPPASVPAPVLVTNGNRAAPYVALTFDACATPRSPAGYDAKLIAALEAAQAPATLFLGGLWMQHHPDATRALAANPRFELANHSWSHPDFRTLTPAQMADEIARTQAEQEQLTGRRGRLFRLPYGFSSPTALAVVAAQGLTCIEWDTVTGDPDPHLGARAILRNALGARNGSIIIMHMNGRGWHTREALPQVVRRLRQRGLTLVTVSHLLGLEPRG